MKSTTEDELKAIAEYVYTFYDQQTYLKEMQAKAEFDALPEGEQLARKNGCLNCHEAEKAKIGPSFAMISTKDPEEIIEVIRNGSQGKWESFRNMIMPSYKDKFTQDELQTLQAWIQTLGEKDKAEPWSAEKVIQRKKRQ
ncbi:MAG: cytochrome c [Sulfurimonas sp.]